jgi:hypothetical protein
VSSLISSVISGPELRMATNWTRLSEIDHNDSIGTAAVMRTAKEIKRTIADPGLYDSVILKVARAMAERTVSPTRVGEICDVVATKRARHDAGRDGKPFSPGRYFVRAIMIEFERAGVPWHSDREGTK